MRHHRWSGGWERAFREVPPMMPSRCHPETSHPSFSARHRHPWRDGVLRSGSPSGDLAPGGCPRPRHTSSKRALASRKTTRHQRPNGNAISGLSPFRSDYMPDNASLSKSSALSPPRGGFLPLFIQCPNNDKNIGARRVSGLRPPMKPNNKTPRAMQTHAETFKGERVGRR